MQDNGTPALNSQATVSISLIDVNEAPIINDQAFTIVQNAPTGTSVGIVEAINPNLSHTLIYSIQSGNASGTFTINPSTGELFVSNPSAIKLKSSLSFELVIKVQDNASASLINQAIITVMIFGNIQPPVVLNQTKKTLEHQPIGTIVGKIEAVDLNSSGPLSYKIISGNIGNGFAINANTGDLTINNPKVVCFEGHPFFNLNVRVSSSDSLSSDATVTIDVDDINEQPICKNQEFSIEENSPINTVVGKVIAKDYDFNQTLTYSIIHGNTNEVFSINPTDGTLSVNNSTALNFEENQKFDLIVSVQDNGEGNLVVFPTITVQLIDVNEAPVMENQILVLNENSAPGSEIAYLLATDPDYEQTLTYTIISGNEGQVFKLDSETGLLTLTDPSKLFSKRSPLSTLTILVQDNGSNPLSALSVITININPNTGISVLPNILKDLDISIYPNPTTDIVNFDLGKIVDQPVSIKLFGINGQEIYSTKTKGEKKISINMEGEKPGIYTAVITINDQTYTKKIIVQN